MSTHDALCDLVFSANCVSQFSSAGPTHMWSGDDLLPAFMYVVVRAQLRNLGAEIRLISDFSPGLRSSGQLSLMFTMLCASYIQIIKEQQIPS
uniref:VPS9 domain-containing protein n=1 Tax=Panagrellus redivivus TaxID=6233 RepID=A0A7E4VHM9_PANRE